MSPGRTQVWEKPEGRGTFFEEVEGLEEFAGVLEVLGVWDSLFQGVDGVLLV